MRIRYQPARNTPEIEIRDLRGHRHGLWRRGEERDIADGETASVREADGTIVIKPVVDALFSCGLDFVDVATGKNPLFVCSACGDVTTDEFFVDKALKPHHIRADEQDANSPRLCLPDFIARHPEHEAQFRASAPMLIAEAKKRRASAPEPEPVAVAAASVDATPMVDLPTYVDEHHDDEGHE